MKDRLESLNRVSRLERQSAVSLISSNRLSRSDSIHVSPATEEILDQIEDIRQDAAEVKRSIAVVSQLHNLLLASLDTSGPDINAVREMISRLDAELVNIETISSSMCRSINDLKDAPKSSYVGPADERIRTAQLFGLVESVKEILHVFNSEYVKYSEATRKSAVEYTRETILKPIQFESNPANAVLDFLGAEAPEPQLTKRQSLRLSMQLQECQLKEDVLRAVLTEIEERNNTVLNIEKSVAELNDLFEQLKFHVDQGNPLSNNIEINIEQAQEYVEKSKIETDEAVKKDEEARTTRNMSVVIAALVVLALLLILFVSIPGLRFLL